MRSEALCHLRYLQPQSLKLFRAISQFNSQSVCDWFVRHWLGKAMGKCVPGRQLGWASRATGGRGGPKEGHVPAVAARNVSSPPPGSTARQGLFVQSMRAICYRTMRAGGVEDVPFLEKVYAVKGHRD